MQYKSPGRGGTISSAGGGGGQNSSNYVRVTDVILDAFHPEYENFGKTNSLNGVFYRELSDPIEESGEVLLRFAYSSNPNFKRVPLKNEIVVVEELPSDNRGTESNGTKTYWTNIVGIWNHPNHNAYPDTVQSGEGDADLGEQFEESDKVAPVQAFPGDVIIEGRHGNSIRFGGTKFDSNIFTEDGDNGTPYTIIRNGQAEPESSVDPVVEDINEDAASIYLGANNTFELTQANYKRLGYLSGDEPEEADVFKGSQVILNAGRLYFNAKEDSAFISSKETIGLNSKKVALDGEDYVGLDAKKIYLGVNSQEENEPVLKGDTTTKWLEDLTKQLETLAKGMATAPPAPPAYVAKMIATSNSVLPLIIKLKSQLKLLHSKKVYTE